MPSLTAAQPPWGAEILMVPLFAPGPGLYLDFATLSFQVPTHVSDPCATSVRWPKTTTAAATTQVQAINAVRLVILRSYGVNVRSETHRIEAKWRMAT